MIPTPLRLALLSLALTACGTGYNTTNVKQYSLTLVSGDRTLVPKLQQLVTEYNQQAGIHVLDYVDDASLANSSIVITPGLQSSTGFVGLGQWLSQTTTASPLTTMPGAKVKQTVNYSMRIEFDQNYLQTMTDYDNQKLFFHEVGHGLQMDHITTDSTEVMYPDVDGDKNFAPYFQRVQAYMAAP